MKTVYMHDAEKAEEKLRKLKEAKSQRISFELAQKTAYLEGYQAAIDDAIEALIHWEFGEKSCKTID